MKRSSDAHDRRRERGFTYIGVLVLVAIIGMAAAATGDLWSTERKREAERELLFVGNQYRQAIDAYYKQSAGLGRNFPMSLDDLLRDPRAPGIRRSLRRLYRDPITGSEEWGMIKGPAGEIMGVYSLSEEVPLKQGNFRKVDAKFEGKQKYSEWEFIYTPLQSVSPAATVPSAKQRTGGSRVPTAARSPQP
ncbi:MAG: type II secretion system protein [Propionivibrio sp.]